MTRSSAGPKCGLGGVAACDLADLKFTMSPVFARDLIDAMMLRLSPRDMLFHSSRSKSSPCFLMTSFRARYVADCFSVMPRRAFVPRSSHSPMPDADLT